MELFVRDGNHRTHAVKAVFESTHRPKRLDVKAQEIYTRLGRIGYEGFIPFVMVKAGETTRWAAGMTANSAGQHVRALLGSSEILSYFTRHASLEAKTAEHVRILQQVFKVQNAITARVHTTSYYNMAGRGRQENGLGGPEVIDALRELLAAAEGIPGDAVFITALRDKV